MLINNFNYLPTLYNALFRYKSIFFSFSRLARVFCLFWCSCPNSPSSFICYSFGVPPLSSPPLGWGSPPPLWGKSLPSPLLSFSLLERGKSARAPPLWGKPGRPAPVFFYAEACFNPEGSIVVTKSSSTNLGWRVQLRLLLEVHNKDADLLHKIEPTSFFGGIGIISFHSKKQALRF